MQRTCMASQINIYSQLSISTIWIADINNSNCWYQQFELSISTIVNVAKAQGRICNSYGGQWPRGLHGAGLAPKMFVFPAINNEKIWLGFISMRGLELSISTIRIVDIHNSNCRYRQFSAIVDINNWNYGYQQFELWISTIVDVHNSNCWYQQFELLI